MTNLASFIQSLPGTSSLLPVHFDVSYSPSSDSLDFVHVRHSVLTDAEDCFTDVRRHRAVAYRRGLCPDVAANPWMRVGHEYFTRPNAPAPVSLTFQLSLVALDDPYSQDELELAHRLITEAVTIPINGWDDCADTHALCLLLQQHHPILRHSKDIIHDMQSKYFFSPQGVPIPGEGGVGYTRDLVFNFPEGTAYGDLAIDCNGFNTCIIGDVPSALVGHCM